MERINKGLPRKLWHHLSHCFPILSTSSANPANIHNQAATDVENQESSHLGEEKGKQDHEDICSRLYQAALSGNWKSAEDVHKSETSAYTMSITKRGDKLLHIAATSKQTEFVRKLVECLPENDLALLNEYGETAFHVAAKSGFVEIAKFMFDKNKHLPELENVTGDLPLKYAFLAKEKKMIEYLFPITPLDPICSGEQCFMFMTLAIKIDMFDIALKILFNLNRRELSSDKWCMIALGSLADKPMSMFPRTSEEPILEKLDRIMSTFVPFMSCFKSVHRSFQMRRQASELAEKLWGKILILPKDTVEGLIKEYLIFHVAARTRNLKLLALLTQTYPQLLWIRDERRRTVLHVAIMFRQDEVFSFLQYTGALKEYSTCYFQEDREYPISFCVGEKPSTSTLNSMVPGAALQMQRELIWYKEVEKVDPFTILYAMGLVTKVGTPKEFFLKQHEDLQKDGEKWMKETANNCMLVATLVATVAFAAAFTVPGGYKSESGMPILLKDGGFTVFLISDAVGMFSSTTSIMMFLSILTSRFGEEDFLSGLPKKLAFGLLTLFVSIVCMVLSFTATLFLAYKEEKQGQMPIFVATLGCIPVILYTALHAKLWIDIIRVAWSSSFMFKY